MFSTVKSVARRKCSDLADRVFRFFTCFFYKFRFFKCVNNVSWMKHLGVLTLL
jgi:hypothetical protein